MPSSLKPIEKVTECNKNCVLADQKPQTESHCLANLPTGTKIGKLKIMRSGKVVMNINDEVLDVTKAIPSQCFEVILHI